MTAFRAFLIALIVGLVGGMTTSAIRADDLQKPAIQVEATAPALQKMAVLATKLPETMSLPSGVVPICSAPKISCESFCFQCRGGRGSCIRDCKNRGNPCVSPC